MIRKILAGMACFLCCAAGAAEKSAVPGIGGISVGMAKGEAFKTAQSAPLFKECENLLDSNALMINAKEGKFIITDSVKISSIKVMFNKTKSVQALSAVFHTQNVDAVEGVYHYAQRLLGPAKETSKGAVGFKFEAEWDLGKYSASFFASDQAFETYLLIAYTSFVKEEELRGTNHPQ
jgi:hypothetical protein